MRRIFCLTGVLALAAALAPAQQVAPPKSHLKVGDKAPEFSVRATDGSTFKLADYRGKSTVVVAFFPAAFTGG